MSTPAPRPPRPARPAHPASTIETKPTATPRPHTRGSDRHFEPRGRNAYLLGIGGCGMSGLARMLKACGAIVQGSDSTPSETTDALLAVGFAVTFDQSRQWLPGDSDLVIHSAAIKPDHPQLLEALRLGLETMTYAEALGRCMAAQTAICVAGTHGKSTTTAMLGIALTDAGLDPTVIVGATSCQLARGALAEPREGHDGNEMGTPTGFRLGATAIPRGLLARKPGLLLAESCEFNRSFHNHRPTLASISSVEADHLDIYGTLDAVVEAFHQFARLIPAAEEGGRLLIAHEGAHRREVTAGLSCQVSTIGFSPAADYVVRVDTDRRTATITHDHRELATWTLALPGVHNAMNAATALVLATWAGAEPGVVARSLSRFKGIDRRTQFLGERPLHAGGERGQGVVRVYDDYGHHPTEIDCTLRALREFEHPEQRGGRLICVFQPHQHSRTRHLLDEFAQSFSQADIVIVPQIYFVRDSEEEKARITSNDLVDRLRARGVRAMHLHPFEAILEQLDNLCRDGDLLVVMGAGPVYKIAHAYMKAGKPTSARVATTPTA
ncbi:MAG: UDP-N-acetylmuramate--L-alanine ligase [Phycisphaerales bacterium]|nr:MAG: UDP-N-acetylmuramate--L-alanine ligase [Phycisphaerales bacterium]